MARHHRWQFTIAHLLGLVAMLAVGLAVGKEIGFAVGFRVLVLAPILLTLYFIYLSFAVNVVLQLVELSPQGAQWWARIARLCASALAFVLVTLVGAGMVWAVGICSWRLLEWQPILKS